MTETCSQSECAKPHRARGLCSTHYNRIVAGESRRHPRESRECVVCGGLVVRRVDNHRRPTCSVRCRAIVQFGDQLAPVSSYTWRLDACHRARKAGVLVIEAFDRETVFDRDGWQCTACHLVCATPDPFDPLAATIDHVVPYAAGGVHSLANAQTMCLSCNSAKHADVPEAAA